MAVSTVLVPFGLTEVVTYALSVAAILITGVVLIQGYRDTAAIHAKLDEIVVALRETRNDVVGLEQRSEDDRKDSGAPREGGGRQFEIGCRRLPLLPVPGRRVRRRAAVRE